jgi:hypothetical protein
VHERFHRLEAYATVTRLLDLQRLSMLNQMQLDAYLHRLAYQGDRNADLAALTTLHQSHLQKIAFENLDIRLGKKLDLSTEALLNKLLHQVATESGFCAVAGNPGVCSQHVNSIRGEIEYRAMLLEYFGMRLPEGTDIERLMSREV